jgi:hypothetical protein
LKPREDDFFCAECLPAIDAAVARAREAIKEEEEDVEPDDRLPDDD